MQIKIEIDRSCTEPEIIIVTDSMTEDIQNIIQKLSEDFPQVISGNREGKVEVLDPTDFIRVYANSGKVFAVTPRGEYTLRLRLYEVEERLDHRLFVRISNSEIINLKQVESFDLSFAGTICVTLSNGTVTYVSRRFVPKIKRMLGI